MRFETFDRRSEHLAPVDTVTRTRSTDSAERSTVDTAPANPQTTGERMDPEEWRKLVEYQAYLLSRARERAGVRDR